MFCAGMFCKEKACRAYGRIKCSLGGDMPEEVSGLQKVLDVVKWPAAKLGHLAEHVVQWIRGESPSQQKEKGGTIEEAFQIEEILKKIDFSSITQNLELQAKIRSAFQYLIPVEPRLDELVANLRASTSLDEIENVLLDREDKRIHPDLRQNLFEKLETLDDQRIRAVMDALHDIKSTDEDALLKQISHLSKDYPQVCSALLEEYNRKKQEQPLHNIQIPRGIEEVVQKLSEPSKPV